MSALSEISKASSWSNLKIHEKDGKETLSFTSTHSNDSSVQRVKEIAKNEIDSIAHVNLELVKVNQLLNNKIDVDLIQILKHLSTQENKLEDLTRCANSILGKELDSEKIENTLQTGHKVILDIYLQIQPQIIEYLSKHPTNISKEVISYLKNISQHEGTSLPEHPSVQQFQGYLTAMILYPNTPQGMYLRSSPSAYATFGQLPVQLQTMYWRSPKTKSTKYYAYLIESLDQYKLLKESQLKQAERLVGPLTFEKKLFLANILTKHGIEALEEIANSRTLEFEKIIKVYRKNPEFGERLISDYLDGNLNTCLVIKEFENIFLSDKSFNPDVIPVYSLALSKAKAGVHRGEIKFFFERWHRLPITNGSIVKELQKLMPHPAVYDAIKNEIDIKNLSLNKVQTYFQARGIGKIAFTTTPPYLMPAMVNGYERSLMWDLKLQQPFFAYLNKCHGTDPLSKTSLKDHYSLLQDSNKEGLYLFFKLDSTSQLTILDTVHHNGNFTDLTTLTKLFAASPQLGAKACYFYQRHHEYLPHLRTAFNMQQAEKTEKLLDICLSNFEKGQPLLQLLQEASPITAKTFLTQFLDQPDLQENFLDLLKADPYSATFLVSNELGTNKEIIHFFTESPTAIQGFVSLIQIMPGINPETFLKYREEIRWIYKNATINPFGSVALLVILELRPNLFMKFREMIDSASSEIGKGLFELAKIYIANLKEPSFDKFTQNVLAMVQKENPLAKTLLNSMYSLKFDDLLSLSNTLNVDIKTPATEEKKHIFKFLSYLDQFSMDVIDKFQYSTPEHQNNVLNYIEKHGFDKKAKLFLFAPHSFTLNVLEGKGITFKEKILQDLIEQDDVNNILKKAVELEWHDLNFYDKKFKIKNILKLYLDIFLTYQPNRLSEEKATPLVVALAQKIVSEGNAYTALKQLKFIHAQDKALLENIDFSQPIQPQLQEMYDKHPAIPKKILFKNFNNIGLDNKEKQQLICKALAECVCMADGTLNSYSLEEAFAQLRLFIPEIENSDFEVNLKNKIKLIIENIDELNRLLIQIELPQTGNPVHTLLKKHFQATTDNLNLIEIKKTVVQALLFPPRQLPKLGSCFATQTVIVTHANDPIRELMDYVKLINEGLLQKSIRKDSEIITQQYPVKTLNKIVEDGNPLALCREFTIADMAFSNNSVIANLNREFIDAILTYPLFTSLFPKPDNDTLEHFKNLLFEEMSKHSAFIYDPELKTKASFQGGWILINKDTNSPITTPEEYIKFLESHLFHYSLYNKIFSYITFGYYPHLTEIEKMGEHLKYIFQNHKDELTSYLMKTCLPDIKNAALNYQLENVPWSIAEGGNSRLLTQTYFSQISNITKQKESFASHRPEQVMKMLQTYVAGLPANTKELVNNNEGYKIPISVSAHAATFLPSAFAESKSNTIEKIKENSELIRRKVISKAMQEKIIEIIDLNFKPSPYNLYAKDLLNRLSSNVRQSIVLDDYLKFCYQSCLDIVGDLEKTPSILNKIEDILQIVLPNEIALNKPIPVIDTNWRGGEFSYQLQGFGITFLTQKIALFNLVDKKWLLTVGFPTFDDSSRVNILTI